MASREQEELIRDVVLPQAFEERRYYRRFHHTIWTLQMTLQLASLAAILANTTQVVLLRESPYAGWLLSGVLFLILPGLAIYHIINYHSAYYWLSHLVSKLMVDDLEELTQEIAVGEFEQAMFQKGWGRLVGRKYLAPVCHPITRGRGHPIFIGTIAILSLLNLALFWVVG